MACAILALVSAHVDVTLNTSQHQQQQQQQQQHFSSSQCKNYRIGGWSGFACSVAKPFDTTIITIENKKVYDTGITDVTSLSTQQQQLNNNNNY
jgi:preprotein translocase subunit YajC